jgi:hypothetical protein
MTQIDISDLDQIGDRLFPNDGNYLQELIDRDIEIFGGQAQIDPELILVVFTEMIPIAIGGLACPPPITEEKK